MSAPQVDMIHSSEYYPRCSALNNANPFGQLLPRYPSNDLPDHVQVFTRNCLEAIEPGS